MSSAAVKPHEVGWAKLKPEYVLADHKPVLNTEYVSAAVKKQLEEAADEGNNSNEPPSKKVKLRGRNRNRPKGKVEKTKLCTAIVGERVCPYGDKCKYLHDLQTFVDAEPKNIGPDCYLFQTYGKCSYGVTCRFSKSHLTEDLKNIVKDDIASYKSKEKTVSNVLVKELQVKLWKRRYDFSRADKVLNSIAPGENDQRKRKELPMPEKPKTSDTPDSSETEKTVTEDIGETADSTGTEDQTEKTSTVNNDEEEKKSSVSNDGEQKTSPVSNDGEEKTSSVSNDGEEIKSSVSNDGDKKTSTNSGGEENVNIDPGTGNSMTKDSVAGQALTVAKDAGKEATGTNAGGSEASSKIVDHGQSEGVIRLRPREKKQLNFMNKTYLAPLTTVGNLPFRRVCKGFGVDVTCGEMAVCTNLLQGQLSEWALLKRHESEDLFGVQLCGGYPDSMTRCAQLITETLDVDFIDINCGCPIDLVFNRGEGSALMGRQSKFEQIVKGMTAVMDVPLTVKLRTGIYNEKNVAHILMPKLRDLGVCLTTLHGRSRVQRYTKTADWDYVGQCAAAAWPMPVFGNGDILSYEDVNARRQQSCISGCMVARGALIKPWIFTEIKEQRHWDISANERFDMYKDFVHYGLEHWGSDTRGIESTRRFLLEWLSFTYRYIPVGLLERVPQQINERPPWYKGRNDLETLLASPSCEDWIKISEMLLGPVPEDFTFLPKHKANAYK